MVKTVVSWPVGGAHTLQSLFITFARFLFYKLKMAEIDNDGEKTADKDDLQTLKVWTDHFISFSLPELK